MKQDVTRLAAGFSFLLIMLASCRKETKELVPVETKSSFQSKKPLEPGFAENDMVMYWNDKVAVVLGTPMRQPDRARYFAIIEIAVHDALNNIKPKYQRYALNERQQFASPDAAVASAAYWSIKGLNRQGNFPVDTWFAESLASIPDGESKQSGIALGRHAAEAIIANRANDGFAQVLNTSVTPPDGTAPGDYRHTNLLNVRYVPNWGTVIKPFVVLSNDQFRPTGPYAVNSPAYATDYLEVKAKGARTGSTRNGSEEMLARFWSENRPSIIWNNLVRSIIAGKKMDAWKTARLFALIHTAMADGLNTSLNSAYHFYYWRPETAIHEGNNDDNDATAPDAGWVPFITEVPNTIPAANFVSPPIPEYPSTYSMYGGVATEILHSFFGSDEIEVDLNSFSLPGTTLHYVSVAQAARDNSLTKIYSGWHFRKSVIDGEATGRVVAKYVFQHQFKEIEE
jgi:hypothetical protein